MPRWPMLVNKALFAMWENCTTSLLNATTLRGLICCKEERGNIMFLSILSSFRFRKMGSDEQLQFAIVIKYVNKVWQRSFVFMRDPKFQALYYTTKH
ncbi:hypothetical protein pdam_00014464 [Pocillopora damicornis]|uniref:Uncharacterized protein n=1 Tax=Pocillopora damicornis TaxID=46731 RepID=A0A3M6UZ03_POCDA|nr:hypothetical protein pdam_00014464 [Pocillopora damicornis]